jgi:endonuclease YncB( thermonuclease family)
MNAPLYRVLHGTFVVRDHAPDAGTLRFVPDRPRELDALPATHRLRVASDRSVRVKLEGIDAPEVNYEGYSQPLAQSSRDALLAEMGFDRLVFDDDGFVRAAAVGRVRGTVFTRGIDIEGRVIGYVVRVPKMNSVRETVNATLLRDGHVYPLAYDTQPPAHREEFAAMARLARAEGKRIWKLDRTRAFEPEEIESCMILPKLFRRVIGYVGDGLAGFSGAMPTWLIHEARGQNDVLVVDDHMTRLSNVLSANAGAISMDIDLAAVVFVAR